MEDLARSGIRNPSDRSGSVLLYVLVISALGMLIFFFVQDSIRTTSRNAISLRIKQAGEEVESNLRTALLIPAAISHSMELASNKALHLKCLAGALDEPAYFTVISPFEPLPPTEILGGGASTATETAGFSLLAAPCLLYSRNRACVVQSIVTVTKLGAAGPGCTLAFSYEIRFANKTDPAFSAAHISSPWIKPLNNDGLPLVRYLIRQSGTGYDVSFAPSS